MKRTPIILCAMLLVISVMQAFGAGAPTASVAEAEIRVTLQLKDTPVANALAVLFEGRGINYTVEPMQNLPTITAVVNDVSFSEALQVLLKAAGLTARKENGVYFISQVGASTNTMITEEIEKQYRDLSAKLGDLRKNSPEDAMEVVAVKREMDRIEQKLLQFRSNQPVPVAPPQCPAVPRVEQEMMTEVIALRYLTVPDIAPMLQSISGLVSFASGGTHTMIVRGTAEAIKEAIGIIAQVDDESAFPESVRVGVEVHVDVKSGSQKPNSCFLSSDGAGIMGVEIPVSLRTLLPGNKNALPVKGQLSARLTPSVAADIAVSLKGNGSFECTIGQQMVSKEFQVYTLGALGEPIVIASGLSVIEGQSVHFEVLATVTLDERPLPATEKKQPAKPR